MIISASVYTYTYIYIIYVCIYIYSYIDLSEQEMKQQKIFLHHNVPNFNTTSNTFASFKIHRSLQGGLAVK